jgi:acyl-CoA thioesterase I
MTNNRHRRSFRCLGSAWVAAVLLLAAHSVCAAEVLPLKPSDLKDIPTEFIATALDPFWQATEIREPVFFIEGKGSDRPSGKLLFKPTEIVSVTSGTRDIKYEAGKDFNVDLATGTITLPPGSRIPFTTQEHLYPLMTSNLPKIGRKSGDRTHGIFFDEDGAYHKLQVEVTYRCEPGQWIGPTPKYAGDSLPKTIAKLRSKQPFKMMLFGDSISAGSNASIMNKTPPNSPPYGELTALALEQHFGSKVTLINKAVDGTTSDKGLKLVKDQQLGKERPDLVIIAFGMNDVYYQHAAAKYEANIRGIIEQIRADSPDTEFILVAPLLANAERGVSMKLFPQNRDALAKLCGPGVALADLTSTWGELLKRKTYYDLTGNGVNHPNDFGHRVYAQTILALLIEAPK